MTASALFPSFIALWGLVTFSLIRFSLITFSLITFSLITFSLISLRFLPHSLDLFPRPSPALAAVREGRGSPRKERRSASGRNEVSTIPLLDGLCFGKFYRRSPADVGQRPAIFAFWELMGRFMTSIFVYFFLVFTSVKYSFFPLCF